MNSRRNKITKIKEKESESKSKVTQSCPTLWDPIDCSPPGSSADGIFRARVLEWVAISFSRGSSPTQGSNLGLPHCRQMLYPLSHQGSYRAFPITVVPLSISRSNIAQWKCIWLRQVDLALTVTSFPWASIIISLSGVCCLYHRFVLRNENIRKIFAQGLPCIRCSIKRDMNFLGGTSGKDPVC